MWFRKGKSIQKTFNFIGISILKNSIQLRNDLAEDPEVVNLDSEKKLVKFSIATNAYYHDTSDDKITNTSWHTIFA
jgi:single-strand DNA-binding protein